MIIINQDRDKSINLHKKLNITNIFLKTNNGVPVGYNIVVKDTILGTFDNMFEAMEEINNINNCKYKYYIVNGFADYLKCFK